MSKFEITPELVSAAFRLAAIGVEYAERMARARGMSDADVAAEWARAKAESANDLGDYVRARGGVWPPSVPTTPDLPPASLPPYYSQDDPSRTTWPSITDIPRYRFSAGDQIWVSDATHASVYFVLPGFMPISHDARLLNPAYVETLQ